jgi:hypothetical protein
MTLDTEIRKHIGQVFFYISGGGEIAKGRLDSVTISENSTMCILGFGRGYCSLSQEQIFPTAEALLANMRERFEKLYNNQPL